MRKKNILSLCFLGTVLCLVFAMAFLSVLSFTLGTVDPSIAAAQEDGDMPGVTVDNDCITISSATILQLATYTQQKTWDGTMEYSTDKVNWTEWDGGYIESAEAADGNHYLYVRGDNNTVVSGGTVWALIKPNKDATIAISGNIETLCGATGDQPADLQMAANCYGGMFNGDEWLSSAPDLTATSLSENCYMQMFQDCISLKQAPELPATTLSEKCYQLMFRGCNGLTTAPELPAATLASYCYAQMFDSCHNLQNPPAKLPADVLKPYCYYEMFIDCGALEKTPDLPATHLAENCCESMFANCFKLKSTMNTLPAAALEKNCYLGMFARCWELQKAPTLPAIQLAEGCYSEMFLNCFSLTAPADLSHVTGLAQNCCDRMYENCLNLAVYQEAQTDRTKVWKATSATESVEGWSDEMLAQTCGDFTGTPAAGRIYYLADTAPVVHTAIPAETEGGSIFIHQKYFIAGKTVEVTASPDIGYVTTAFAAKGADGTEIPIVDNAFTMPDYDVTIIAAFKRNTRQSSIARSNKNASDTDATENANPNTSVDPSNDLCYAAVVCLELAVCGIVLVVYRCRQG